jgi:hypothetical protein
MTAHLWRVEFRHYLRSHGLNPCALDLEPDDRKNGTSPDAIEPFLLWLEWLETYPARRCEFKKWRATAPAPSAE